MAQPRRRRFRESAVYGFGLLLAMQGGVLAPQAHAADCPAGGTLHYGVVPYDASAAFVPLYKRLGVIIGEKLGCPVEVQIGTSYTATIEAMRAGKLDIAEFGPLSYVLAHQIARAEAVATYGDAQGRPDTYTASIVTWPGSGITALPQVAGHSFAYSDAASTSGHLFPAQGLQQAGIDPDHGVKPVYAGSHTASFEALRHHKVDAGELNSPEIASAEAAGIWNPAEFVTLWTSAPIPQDAVAVRADLDPTLKARVTEVLEHLDLSVIPAAETKLTGLKGKGYVPTTDAAYDPIRALVSVLHLDLTKLGT